jgi:hypothetical protein
MRHACNGVKKSKSARERQGDSYAPKPFLDLAAVQKKAHVRNFRIDRFYGTLLNMKVFAVLFVVGSLFACTSEAPISTPAVTKNCAKYCADIDTQCKNELGIGAANKQYFSTDACLTMCGAMDTGTSADRNVDTFNCRLNALGLVTESGAPGSDAQRAACYNAGPYSKVCGNTDGECAAFCKINVRLCQGTNSPFGGNEAQCVTDCKVTRDTKKNGLGAGGGKEAMISTPETNLIPIPTGDSLICRGYHMNIGAHNANNRGTHCPHTVFASVSAPCQ